MATRRTSSCGPAARPPLPALVLRLVLLGFLARHAAGQDSSFTPNPLFVELVCSLVKGFSSDYTNSVNVCNLGVDPVERALLRVPASPYKCPDLTEAGYGLQMQPPALSSALLPAALANKPQPQPLKGFPSAVYTQPAAASLLQKEGPTYAWLWQALRNFKFYWPCSKRQGGNLDGYLAPIGWEPAGNSSGGAEPGVYDVKTGNTTLPVMVALKQKYNKTQKVRQLVFLVRAGYNLDEWTQALAYDKVKWRAANRSAARTFTGDKFAGNSFSSNKYAGETHHGYTLLFDGLWPAAQAVIKAQVVKAPKTTAATQITFAGDAGGAPAAALLSLAAKYYLKASKKSSVGVGYVTFGSPAFTNLALAAEIGKNVAARSLAFDLDLISVLPCTSPPEELDPGNAPSAAMVVCDNATNVPVPVPPPGPNITTVWYYRDYAVPYGTITFSAANVSASVSPLSTPQGQAWNATRNVWWKPENATLFMANIIATQTCSISCLLWKYAQWPAGANNYCVLNGTAAGGDGLCPTTGGL